MKTEFEQQESAIHVLEHVIRKAYDNDCFEEKFLMDYFQANITIDDFSYDQDIHCVISYYGPDSEFCGLDRGTLCAEDLEENKPIPFSVPVTIPDNAERMVVRFSCTKEPVSILQLAWGAGITLTLLLLLAWVLRSFGLTG